jgi:small-conductance mechanosensitive channel
MGFLLLGVILGALVCGLFLTRGGDVNRLDTMTAPGSGSTDMVDESALAAARRLAAEAHGPVEQQDAAQALRFADHAVDQAFETALREATANVAPLKGEPLAISQKIAALEKKVEAEKQQVADLTAAQSKAADQDDAAQQVELAQAQLDLDNDELNDLHEDLIRLGGDKHAKVQQALDEHEAAQKQPMAAAAVETDAESAQSVATLPGKIKAFIQIDAREKQLREAGAEASSAANELTQQHEALDTQAEASAASMPTPNSGATTAAAAMNAMHALSGQRKTMMEYDARIHDQQQLAAIYRSWADLVAAKKLSVLHGILRTVAVLVTILLVALLGLGAIRREFARRVKERRKLGHYRVIAELVLQLVALAIVLIVIFGTPTQMPAILGLVTAGITIVMKDFIVAFIGWFPLMGKNGIRVGDWVEINGVSGEVVEIGMLRTILLETGSLADAGHPTGRRVTFMNSFAIEGRYFNFSTSGQWLWDELRVRVPKGDDAYDRIEAIRRLIAEVTQQDATIAEQEWRQATKDEALRGFSAAPTIDLRPASDGIDVTVRYITRAQKRYEVRSSLYQDVIRLLQGDGVAQLAENADA